VGVALDEGKRDVRGFTDAGGVGHYRLEHRLNVHRQAADRPQDLGRRRLLFQHAAGK